MLMPLRATLNISSTDVNIALTAVSPVLGPYATKWGCCCCPRRHEIHTPSSRSQNPSPRQTEFRPRLCSTSACVVLFFEVSSNITHTHTLPFTAEVVHCCYVCDLSQHKFVSACYCSAALNKLPQQLSHCLKMHTL